jgi:hypothetical protein
LLRLYGDDWKPKEEYATYSLNAYPMALREIRDRSWFTPEESYMNCFTSRSFTNFTVFFGLAEQDPSNKRPFSIGEYKIRKLPLLDEIVNFKL